MLILNMILDIVCFFIFITAIVFVKDKIINYFKNKNVVSSDDWLPNEQIMELRQVFYLVFAGLLFVDLYYLVLINTSMGYFLISAIFDLIVSICAAVYIFDKNNLKKTVILLLALVPLTSSGFTAVFSIPIGYFWVCEIIHSLAIIYMIIVMIHDFKKYSASNRLGYTILLLYVIIFVCVFLTSYAEGLDLLDSVVYCSNAFTSNGFGLVDAGNLESKFISIVLVWAGYILSGVSTALLTIALLSNVYKKKYKVLKKNVDMQKKELKEVNEKLDEILTKIQ